MHAISNSVLMLFTKKISKLVHACRNYSLPKLVRFWDTVYYVAWYKAGSDWREFWIDFSFP